MIDQSSVEAWINLLGPSGITEIYKQAKDRPFITEIHRFGNISLEIHTLAEGRQRVIADLQVEPVLRISVAGTWVEAEHWTDDFGWRRYAEPGETVESMHRIWYDYRDQFRSDGALIMPALPSTGWYTKERQRHLEPYRVAAHWFRNEFESRLLSPSGICLGLAVVHSDGSQWLWWSNHERDQRYVEVPDRASAEATLREIWSSRGIDIMSCER